VPKEIHAILTETLACFLPGQAKDLSAPLYSSIPINTERLLATINIMVMGTATVVTPPAAAG